MLIKRAILVVIGLGISFLLVGIVTLEVSSDDPLGVTVPQAEFSQNQSVKLTFVGDIMFDRYVRDQQGPGYQYVLAPALLKHLRNTDGVVGNLEGPITDFSSVFTYDQTSPDHYRFTFDPVVATVLKQANFIALSIGNNHITNFGNEGVQQTRSYLQQAGIASFGDPNEAAHTVIITINEIKLGFVAYNYADAIPLAVTLKNITNLANQVDQVIVLPHWGTEYETMANPSQINLAKQFAGAGADLIIGSHPHVVQNNEKIDNAITYYSLGNFIFDQYFSPGVRCGLVTTFEFTKKSIWLTESINSYLATDGSTRIARKDECS